MYEIDSLYSIGDRYGVRDVQLRMLEMLKDFDCFCRNNDIKYSIDGGTLLGALRHKGFIPWDDDVDIMFDRYNYMKFIKLSSTLPNKYEIIGNIWVKRLTRKDNPYKQDEEECMDLFVWDNVPKNKVILSIKKLLLKVLQGMLKKDVDYSKYSLFNKFRVYITHIAGMPFSVETKQIMYDKISQWGNEQDTPEINIYNAFYHWVDSFSYSCELMKNIADIDFEDTKVMAVEDADRYLTVCYGDYMKLPPEDQRIPAHRKHSKTSVV